MDERLRKTLRWVSGLIFAFLGIAALLLLSFQLAGQDARRELLLTGAGLIPGLDLQLGEEFSWQLSTRFELDMTNVQLRFITEDGVWQIRGQSLALSFPLWPLLTGRLAPDLQARGLEVMIETRDGGRHENAWPRILHLDPGVIRIADLKLTWKHDQRTEHLYIESLVDERTSDNWQLSLKGRFNDQPLQLLGGPDNMGRINLSGSLGSIALKAWSQGAMMGDVHLSLVMDEPCRSEMLSFLGLPCKQALKLEFLGKPTKEALLLKNLHLSHGDSTLEGELAIRKSSDEGLKIEGELKGDSLNLGFLLHPDSSDTPMVVRNARKTTILGENDKSSERLFSSRAFQVDWMKMLALDIRLELKHLRLSRLVLGQVKLPLQLKEGRLRIGEFKALVGRQPFRGRVIFDVSMKPPRYEIFLQGRELAFLQPPDHGPGKSGNARLLVNMKLSGHGNSLAEQLGSMKGEMLLGLEDYSVGKGLHEGLLERLLQILDPVKKDEQDRLQCGAVYFRIQDGKATTPRGIAAVFEQATWLGQGNVDLATEKISVEFRPLYRKGLGLRLKGMAGLVMLGGTLSRPTILIDPKGALRNSLSVAAAVSTGGASLLLEGLLEKNRANSNVCGEILQP